MTADQGKVVVTHLMEKINGNADKIIMLEEDQIDGADIVVVSYGITSRIAVKAIQDARKEGIKVGSLRLVTIWPFCEKRIRELAGQVKAIVVPEINYGQMVLEVERSAAGQCQVISVNHCGGAVHDPEVILEAIRKASK
jgi:2-oxoglutarate ferredoxin oxidoreductase subunit alpha